MYYVFKQNTVLSLRVCVWVGGSVCESGNRSLLFIKAHANVARNYCPRTKNFYILRPSSHSRFKKVLCILKRHCSWKNRRFCIFIVIYEPTNICKKEYYSRFLLVIYSNRWPEFGSLTFTIFMQEKLNGFPWHTIYKVASRDDWVLRQSYSCLSIYFTTLSFLSIPYPCKSTFSFFI